MLSLEETFKLVLLVQKLQPVFKKHFKIKPTSDPKGPFISFCRQSLIELKILNKGRPFSRKLLSQAFMEEI